jgi:hypothetical protein
LFRADRTRERRRGHPDRQFGHTRTRARTQHDRHGHTQPGTAGDPDQVRIGQGITERALIGGTGQRQHAADQQSQHHARQPEFDEDRNLTFSEAAVHLHPRKQVEHLHRNAADRQRNRAERETQNHRDQNRDDPRGQPHRTQPGGPAPAHATPPEAHAPGPRPPTRDGHHPPRAAAR